MFRAARTMRFLLAIKRFSHARETRRSAYYTPSPDTCSEDRILMDPPPITRSTDLRCLGLIKLHDRDSHPLHPSIRPHTQNRIIRGAVGSKSPPSASTLGAPRRPRDRARPLFRGPVRFRAYPPTGSEIRPEAARRCNTLLILLLCNRRNSIACAVRRRPYTRPSLFCRQSRALRTP